MGEKIDELYKQYLNEKLDAIFNGENGIISENNSYEKSNPKKFQVLKVDPYRIEDFHEGYAHIVMNNKHNFVDINGNLLFNTWDRFDEMGDFHEGYARVKKDGKWNFIDTNGKLLSDIWYDDARDFYEGYAIVKNKKDGRWIFIDTTGKYFHGGYVRVKKDGKNNFIDTTGKLLSDIWYEDVRDFYEGYAIVKKDDKYNFMDTNGNLLSDIWYENARDFHEGYARVKNEKDGRWNFIDTNGKLLLDESYFDLGAFHEGYAKVYIYGEWNFININGKLLSDIWYEDARDFHEGYARVKKDGKYNFIDTNGKLLSDTWFENANDFNYGYAIVKKDGNFNIIDTVGYLRLSSSERVDKVIDCGEGSFKLCFVSRRYEIINLSKKFVFDRERCLIRRDGCVFLPKILSKDVEFPMIVEIEGKYYLVDCDWKAKVFDEIHDFSEDYARVRKNGEWNFIDKFGHLLFQKWLFYAKVSDICHNFIKVSKSLYGSEQSCIINKKGEIVLPYGQYKELDILPNFFIVDGRIIPCKKEMGDYQVNRILMGYECKNSHDKYRLKYQPVKKFGFRYTICINKENLFLYDRISNEYRTIGDIYDIEFDDNFIFDKKNKKVYLMYEDKMIDVTEYYNNNLSDKKKISVTSGIGNILTREEFAFLNASEIERVMQEEKIRKQKEQEEKERQEKLKKIEEQKKRMKKEKEEHLRKQQAEKDKAEQDKIEALKKIQEGLAMLKKNGVKDLPIVREKIENIFVINDDYKEIDSDYIDILMLIDLLNVDFTNVKISGIDFRGTNIEIGGYNLKPQTVYNKDLSNCNFEGIYINPLANFTGVNIKSTRFSIDNNPMTMDMFNITFKDAIWDENTTYNGRSFSEIFEEIKKKR